MHNFLKSIRTPSWIWIWVTEFISYSDNHYTTSAPAFLVNKIMPNQIVTFAQSARAVESNNCFSAEG